MSLSAGEGSGNGSDHQRGRWIRLVSHEFDPIAGPPALPPGMSYPKSGPTEEAYHIVQFRDRITREMRPGGRD